MEMIGDHTKPAPNYMSEEGLTEFGLALREIELTQFHEAGHAVIFYLKGFHPKRITGALTEHDQRSTSFFRTCGWQLGTPHARERAQDFAVCIIAGIAAESKISGIPLAGLRETSGQDDYKYVHAILDKMMYRNGFGFERCPEVRASYLHQFESRATALMEQPSVWAAVESVVAELVDSCGELEGEALVSTIERGLSS